MTIIIGAICKDAIVVGSDGQTSATTSQTSKRLDTDKIAVVKFQNKQDVMVAQSGNVVITSRLIEMMQAEAVNIPITDYRTPADCAQRAIKKLKAEILEPFLPEKRKAEELQSIFNSYDASLLLAFYFDEKNPLLFAIDFSIGIACQQQKYALLGCGANVGEFLAGWFPFSEMTRGQTLIAVAFIIGEVKKVDAYCGGPTHIKNIKLGNKEVTKLKPEALKILESGVELGSQKYKSKWSETAEEMATEIGKQLQPLIKSKDE